MDIYHVIASSISRQKEVMARDQLSGFKQNLEIEDIEEKDTGTLRRWQLDGFFEAVEKDKRTEDERRSADSIHRGT